MYILDHLVEGGLVGARTRDAIEDVLLDEHEVAIGVLVVGVSVEFVDHYDVGLLVRLIDGAFGDDFFSVRVFRSEDPVAVDEVVVFCIDVKGTYHFEALDGAGTQKRVEFFRPRVKVSLLAPPVVRLLEVSCPLNGPCLVRFPPLRLEDLGLTLLFLLRSVPCTKLGGWDLEPALCALYLHVGVHGLGSEVDSRHVYTSILLV